MGKGKKRCGVCGALAEGGFGTNGVSGESLKRLEGCTHSWLKEGEARCPEVTWDRNQGLGLAFTCSHLLSSHNGITYVYPALF